jgi:hypothetical protein
MVDDTVYLMGVNAHQGQFKFVFKLLKKVYPF